MLALLIGLLRRRPATGGTAEVILWVTSLAKIVYPKSSTLANERKNKWTLPSGALEQIGPKWRCRAPDGSAHFDRVDDFT